MRQLLVERIGEPATLELLAEECTELAHAALKLARKERGENPTPVYLDDCHVSVVEEWADVIICLEQLEGLEWAGPERFNRIYEFKQKRLKERIGAK